VQTREVVRQEIVDGSVGGCAEFGQHPADVGLRVDADQSTRPHHTVDHRRTPAGGGVSDEQIVAQSDSERARLGILASLLAHPKGLTFADLLDLCDLTDGNLSRHLQALQTAELVTVSRDTGAGRQQSVCRITAAGRKRFHEYLTVLERTLCEAAFPLDSGLHPPLVSVRS